MKFFFGMPLAGLLAAGLAMQTPIPVRIDKEPNHHASLANGTLLVLKVMLPPGESTAYHTHPYDGVAIHLSSL